jgi:hypothetical protein
VLATCFPPTKGANFTFEPSVRQPIFVGCVVSCWPYRKGLDHRELPYRKGADHQETRRRPRGPPSGCAQVGVEGGGIYSGHAQDQQEKSRKRQPLENHWKHSVFFASVSARPRRRSVIDGDHRVIGGARGLIRGAITAHST